jgi:moderate conductance mechanosensitive channel
MTLNELIRWLLINGLTLVVGAVVLLVAYRIGTSAIHRIVPGVLRAQAAHLPPTTGTTIDVDKRVQTIEDLLLRLLRVVILALLGALVLAVFELWSLLVAIVIVIAAVVFASKEVVQDYVIGFLNLVEGPFFKGDWVRVGGPGAVEGVVEEIGLRRTLLRDGFGTMHAVANGLIRQSSNWTRVFSIATIDVVILHGPDLDRALAVARDAGDAIRADPAWAASFPEDASTELLILDLGIDGTTVRIQHRTQAGHHGLVASELRRRLAAAFAQASIGTGRWDAPLPIATTPGSGR